MRGRRAKTAGGAGDDALPTMAYLMEGERCSRDCGFCPQARSASSRDDLLARVNWPEVGGESGRGEGDSTGDEAGHVGGKDAVTAAAFWEGLARAVDEGQFRRACFQLTASPRVLAKVEAEVRRLHALRPALPICVSVAARDVAEVGRILDWGAERVTIALDAGSPELHRRVKGGPLEPRLALLRAAAALYPGRVGTHLIAGLGETEQEMVLVFQEMTDLGVTVALFAFTPIPGTRLADREPPDLRSYRRLQAARHLIAGGHARAEAMTFDGAGRLTGYGLPWDEVARLLVGGEAFRTSGCPDCNRPYYNERPSGPLYNYPRPLTPEEAGLATEEARPVTESAVEEARPVPAGRTERARATPATSEPPVEDGLLPAGGRSRPAGAAWRLVVERSPRSGAWNMAVDEAILVAHAAGRVAPTLRFYRWDPPAVSLGYFQDPVTEVDREACRRAGLDIIRRPTGGRAVLHDREVTYSVVVTTDLLPGTVVETYRSLAGGLVLGLRELGADAVLAPEKATPGGPGNPHGACFEVPSSYEIVVGGRKVVGSAQVRRQGVILQHGAILLELDAPLLARALGFAPAAATRIAAKAVGLGDVLGRVPGYDEVCRAVAKGLQTALGIRFETGRLTSEEVALARRLIREKYGRDSWNLKVPENREEAEGARSGSAGARTEGAFGAG